MLEREKNEKERKERNERMNRHIEIDLEIHKLIEQERTDFAEPDYVILRRLLGLKDLPASYAERPTSGWTGKGIHLPNGTKLKMQYKGQVIGGEISDGKWKVRGKDFLSPTGAAKHAASLADPSYDWHAMNGWHYWQVQLPGETQFQTLSERTSDRT